MGGARIRFRRKIPSRSKIVLLSFLTAGCLLSGIAAISVFVWENRTQQREFRAACDLQARGIQGAVNRRLLALEAIHAAYDASEQVTRHEFRTLVAPFVQRLPGTRLFAWVKPVRQSERKDFEARIRKRGMPGFELFEREHWSRAPVTPRLMHFPITFAEPAQAKDLLGFDLASDKILVRAMADAQENGDPIVSQANLSVRDKQPSLMVVLPVYDAGRFEGFFVGEFDIAELVAESMSTQSRSNEALTIRNQDLLLHSSPERLADATSLIYDRDLDVLNKRWRLTFQAGPRFFTGRLPWLHWAVLFAGLALTVAVTFFNYTQLTRFELTEHLVSKRTRELEDSRRMAVNSMNESQAARQRAEEIGQQLKRSEEELKVAHRLARIGSWKWDVSKDEFTCSDEMMNIIGIQPEHRTCRIEDFIETYVHPDSRETLRDDLDAISLSSQNKAMEFRIIRPSGTERWIHVIKPRINREEGEIKVVFGTVQDITERKEFEDALQAAKDWAEQLYRVVPSAIFTVDTKQRITSWNREAETITGYSAREMLGQKCLTFARSPCRDQCGLFSDSIVKPVKGKECVIVTKNGSERTIEKNVDYLRNTKGKVVGGVETFQDVTERKRIQDIEKRAKEELEEHNRQLQIARDQAQEANRAKSEFLANMSHEIRTPLNGVIGMTGVLLETRLDSEQSEFVDTIRRSGEALLDIINDILDFSKIEAGKWEIEKIDFDLRIVIEETADLLALRAQDKGLEFISLVEPEVPALLTGDPARLRQILLNLAGNAIKFTESGEVSIRISLVEENKDTASLQFQVQDTGIGIPQHRQDDLFDAFTQVDASTTRQYGGTGLGLAICKRIVSLMGGTIEVDSEVGFGSTFTFTLRFAKQTDNQIPDEFVSIADTNVLVVDDNATNRRLLEVLLRSWKCRHEEADNAERAIDLLRQSQMEGAPFDAAIIDQQMPGVSGEELGRMISRDEDIASTALILMTSLGAREDRYRLEEYGFSAYLPKPVKQDQLHDCIAIVLGRKKRRDAGTRTDLITTHTVLQSQKQRYRILIAEDNKTNRNVARAMLNKLGYRPDIVADGLEAVNALRQIPYDMVLMDCHMPELDGYKATRQIRSTDSGCLNPGVVIIAMTANALKGDKEKCLEAGMDDYIAKPINSSDMATIIEKWASKANETVDSQAAETGNR